MKYRASVKNILQEKIVQCNPTTDILRRAHHKINRSPYLDLVEDLHSFADAVPAKGHDDEKINIGFIAGSAVGGGTKENRSLRLEFPDDSIGELPNLGKGDPGQSIPQQVEMCHLREVGDPDEIRRCFHLADLDSKSSVPLEGLVRMDGDKPKVGNAGTQYEVRPMVAVEPVQEGGHFLLKPCGSGASKCTRSRPTGPDTTCIGPLASSRQALASIAVTFSHNHPS